MPDPKDKNQPDKTQQITQGNNPNDDEEILKNNDESGDKGRNTDNTGKVRMKIAKAKVRKQ